MVFMVVLLRNILEEFDHECFPSVMDGTYVVGSGGPNFSVVLLMYKSMASKKIWLTKTIKPNLPNYSN